MMLKKTAADIWESLQANNHKSFYLAFTRVVISLLILKDLFFNWGSIGLLYSQHALLSPKDYDIQKILFVDVDMFQQHPVLFMLLFILLLILNILGFGKWITGILVFLCYDFLQKQHLYMVSGGERMARLVLLYLSFANSYEYFSVKAYQFKNVGLKRFSNLVSNLASLSVMIQLCLAYLASALAKLNAPLWRKGIATYYILTLDSYQGTAINKLLVQQKWFVYLSSYFTLAFELLFPVLIWINKLRKYLLFAGILFHLSIYIFMMIYGFQWIFVLCYGFFISNNKWLSLYARLRNVFGYNTSRLSAQAI